MTHFRFRFKHMGYIRWRCRAARRRVVAARLPLAGAAWQNPSTATWRQTLHLAPAAWTPTSATLQVGDFIVGEAGDAQLHGHPGIRY